MYTGGYLVGTRWVEHRSGTAIGKAPAGALVLNVPLTRIDDLQSAARLQQSSRGVPAASGRRGGSRVEHVGALALLSLPGLGSGDGETTQGGGVIEGGAAAEDENGAEAGELAEEEEGERKEGGSWRSGTRVASMTSPRRPCDDLRLKLLVACRSAPPSCSRIYSS